MTVFAYTATDSKGREQKGVLEGDTARQIRQQLRDRGLFPLEISAVTSKSDSIVKPTIQITKRVSYADLTLFTRQLATLLAAGLPIEEAVIAISEQTEKVHFKNVIQGVHDQLTEGHSLATAMSSYPRIFSHLYCATIAAGEQTSHLDKVLARLADYTEQQQFIRQKIQQALIYPAIMLTVAFSIVGFLLAYVVPKIIGIFKDSGQQLPLVTTILIDISNILQNFGLYLVGLIVILLWFFKRMLKYKNFRYQYEELLLRLPMIGKYIKLINSARFARTFGILTAAGVPVLEAMGVAAEVITNLPIQEAVQDAVHRVREGTSIHISLKKTAYFSPMCIYLIASGEASGQLEFMLERAANYQDQEVASAIEIGLALFEPLLILTMGSIVLFIVLAILLPIFSLNQLVS